MRLVTLAVADVDDTRVDLSTHASCSEAAGWYAGSFRKLPERTGSLIPFVGSHPHPSTFSSVPLGSAREIAFTDFVTALLDAVDANRTNNNAGDWCLVKARATTAGYGVYRFWVQVRDANPASPDEGTEWWFSSVRTSAEWQRVALPFSRLRSIQRNSDGKLDPDKVRALVFIVDLGAMKAGSSGTLWIDDLGVY